MDVRPLAKAGREFRDLTEAGNAVPFGWGLPEEPQTSVRGPRSQQKGRAAEERKRRAPQRYPTRTSAVPAAQQTVGFLVRFRVDEGQESLYRGPTWGSTRYRRCHEVLQ